MFANLAGKYGPLVTYEEEPTAHVRTGVRIRRRANWIALAALHAPRKIDVAFTRQQRYRAHLAKIRAHRVVRGDELFHRLLIGMKKIFCHFGIEEFYQLLPRNWFLSGSRAKTVHHHREPWRNTSRAKYER
jgi:hypothetical protein